MDAGARRRGVGAVAAGTAPRMGHDKAEVDYYLIDVFLKRVKMNLNGSNWQKNFVAMYGKDFNSLTEAYVGNQQRGLPLWRWKI